VCQGRIAVSARATQGGGEKFTILITTTLRGDGKVTVLEPRPRGKKKLNGLYDPKLLDRKKTVNRKMGKVVSSGVGEPLLI